jgi:hypothetical protein
MIILILTYDITEILLKVVLNPNPYSLNATDIKIFSFLNFSVIDYDILKDKQKQNIALLEQFQNPIENCINMQKRYL